SLVLVTNEGGTRHVEVMSGIFEEGDALTDAWFLDNAIAATAYVENQVFSGSSTGVKAYGFWHLNGKTVTVFAGGLDLGDFLVTNGTIELPYGSKGPLSATAGFTAAFVAAFSGAMKI